MKQGIHPTYYSKVSVKCACGNTFETGATVPKLEVEICSDCHPFFTGKAKLLDSAGRVDKFKARAAKAKTFGAPKMGNTDHEIVHVETPDQVKE